MPYGYRRSDSARALRYRVALLLHDSDRPWTVGDVVAALQRADVPLPPGRLNKLVSDSMRWEIGRGRVVRLERGRYARGSFGRGTAAWMRSQLTLWDEAAGLDEPDRERVSDNDARLRELDQLVADTLANIARGGISV